ncbi:MAG: hypothetical protein ACRDYX_04405 [Egibacteraceae bacterium]
MNHWRQADPGRCAEENPVTDSSAQHSASERLVHGPLQVAGARRCSRCHLLPPELEAARAMVPVADPLTAKRKRGSSAKATPRLLQDLPHIYGRTDVLAHIGFGPDEAYMLIDKRHPHALFEIMLMSAGPALRSGLHDHSARFGAAVGALTACFVEYCQDRRLYPTVSWSYDPATVDRESIQGEKRFHAHLVGRSADELARVAALTMPAQAYPPPQRRRTVDEAGVLGALLAADCLADIRLRTLRVVEPLSSPAATAALQLRVCGGWAAFTDPALYTDLCGLHSTLRHIYDRIAAACLTGSSGRWQRPTLWTDQVRDVDLPLTPASREALGHYLSALRPSLLHDTAAYEDPRNRHWTTHVYPLADLAYSICFSEHKGRLYAYVRLNVFSDLGGAGVSVIDATVVRIRKGVGTVSDGELAARQAFQRGYLARLRCHPELAERALYPTLASA